MLSKMVKLKITLINNTNNDNIIQTQTYLTSLSFYNDEEMWKKTSRSIGESIIIRPVKRLAVIDSISIDATHTSYDPILDCEITNEHVKVDTSNSIEKSTTSLADMTINQVESKSIGADISRGKVIEKSDYGIEKKKG